MSDRKHLYNEVFEEMEKILNGTEENPDDPIWCAIMIHYYMSELTDPETGKKITFPHIMWSDILINNGAFKQDTYDYYKGKEYPTIPKQELKREFYTPEYIRTIFSQTKTRLDVMYYRKSTAFVPSPEDDGSFAIPLYERKVFFLTDNVNRS